MTLYLIADLMLAAACFILHVTMMQRYHARADLRFRATLIALAVVFGVCCAVFLIDAWQVCGGDGIGGPWPRFVAGVVSLAAAIVVARPGTQAYYMSISTPESVEELRGQIGKILKGWEERSNDVRRPT